VQVALHIVLATVNERPAHTTLEGAEKVFDVVCGEAVLIDVFIAVVSQRLVSGKFFADLRVELAFVAHEG
jgi:hypothetical protein